MAIAGEAAIAQVVPLGALPGSDYTQVLGMSADGSTVVGVGIYHDGTPWRAFRWTAAAGIQDITPDGPAPWFYEGSSRGCTSDGSLVVGEVGGAGFVWREDGDPSMISAGAAYGVSADGSVVVGFGVQPQTTATRAYRHTATGTEYLGVLPGGTHSWAMAVSADGSIVAGTSETPHGDRAFRWTEATGIESLGFPINQSERQSRVSAISADGTVIVGWGEVSAFRWTREQGMRVLSYEHQWSDACATNRDGSAIVGWADGRAFLWTEVLGMVDLNTYLPSIGFDLGTWKLGRAGAISADGRTIAGVGSPDDVQQLGWILTLPTASHLCPANCDGSTVEPFLNANDFACFLNRFAAQDWYANCDGSTNEPWLNANDFQCFLNRFAAGCP